jgi:hypothetical protein
MDDIKEKAPLIMPRADTSLIGNRSLEEEFI